MTGPNILTLYCVQGDKHFLPSVNNEHRLILTDCKLTSLVMREIVSRMSRSDIFTLVNHKENCQWTVYELRRKYLGFPVDPLKDGKAMIKPNLLGEVDNADPELDDGDTDSIAQ